MSFTQKSLLICPPDHFDVIYEINAWMSVDQKPEQAVAREQWHQYENVLAMLDFDLYYLRPEPGVPDLVFTANHGLIRGNKVVLATMKHPERQLEAPFYSKWFEDAGLETYTPKSGFYEGEGDSFIIGDTLYYGYGFRSEKSVAEEIKDFLGLSKIIYVKLTDPYFYHFDTCFAPLGQDLAMLYESAIEPESLAEIKKNLEVISVSKEEAHRFCCNAVVGGKDVVMPEGCFKVYLELANRGFNPYQVQLNQYLKAGGAAKCLCLKLSN